MASSPFLAAIRSLPQRGSRGILSGALVLGCLAAACLAADAPPPAPQTQPKDQPPQETRVFTLGPAEAVPTDFTIRTGVAGIVRTIEDFRKDLPPGHKTKVVMGKFYNANNGRFEDGIVSLTPLDDQGKIDGVERHFDLGEGSGGLARTVAYKHGVQDGPEQLYAAGSRSGRYVQKTVLWKAGRYVQKTVLWKAGRIEGAVRMFHPNGKLMSEATYAAGVLEGMTRSFAPDGSLVRQTPYKAGQRHGTSTEYWPGTDKLKSVIPYDTGKAHGLARLYYDTGKLKKEIECRQGKFHGLERQYDDQGGLIKTVYWFQDDPAADKAEFDRRTQQAATQPKTSRAKTPPPAR